MIASHQLMADINKLMGASVLHKGSDQRFVVTYISTGLLPIDIALRGGLPRGRFVQISGAYSTLKTFIGLHAIAEVQRLGGTAALIDTEHAYDPVWAAELGVDTDSLIVWPPLDNQSETSGEMAIDVAEVLIRNKVDLIVFDSVAATLPQAEQGKRLSGENTQPARLAALMSAACRKLTASNARTAVLWINQLREQIGVTFGNPEKATGGRALPYYASIMLNIRQAGKITKDKKIFTGDKHTGSKVQIGQTFKAVVEKSKLSSPWSEVFFDFDLRTGTLDMVKFLFAQGVELGLITSQGQTWQYEGLKARGKDKFLHELATHQVVLDGLEDKLRREYNLLPLHGKFVPDKKSAIKSNGRSSESTVRGRTLVRGQGGSGTTARPLKRLSK